MTHLSCQAIFILRQAATDILRSFRVLHRSAGFAMENFTPAIALQWTSFSTRFRSWATEP